jgi:hypothetical protein
MTEIYLLEKQHRKALLSGVPRCARSIYSPAYYYHIIILARKLAQIPLHPKGFTIQARANKPQNLNILTDKMNVKNGRILDVGSYERSLFRLQEVVAHLQTV